MKNIEIFEQMDLLFESMIDALEESEMDFDDDDEKIEITTPESQIFLLNKNKHALEIWVSSPKSGPHHYKYTIHDGGFWKNTRNDTALDTLLKEELGLELK